MKNIITTLITAFSFSTFAQSPYDTFLVYPNCQDEENLMNCFMEKVNDLIDSEFSYSEDGEFVDVYVSTRLTFNVNGDISEIKFMNETPEALQDEVRRVFALLEKVQPALKDGEPVEANVFIPIYSSKDGEGQPLNFATVEKKPVFKGCEDFESEEERATCFQTKMAQHIGANFKFPESASKEEAQGVIVVNFIIERDGSVSSVRVLRSVHPDLDAEAIRVISLLSDFEPAMQRGEPVRMSFNMPINAKVSGAKPNPQSGRKFQKN
jgi:TonB family protein